MCLLLCASLACCATEKNETVNTDASTEAESAASADESRLLPPDKALERIKTWWGNVAYGRRAVTGLTASALGADADRVYPTVDDKGLIEEFTNVCAKLSTKRLTYVGAEIPQEGTLFGFQFENESPAGNTISFSVVDNDTYLLLKVDGATYAARVSCNDEFKEGTIKVFEDYMYYLKCQLTEDEAIARTKALWNSIVVDRTREVYKLNLWCPRFIMVSADSASTSDKKQILSFLNLCSELQLDELTYAEDLVTSYSYGKWTSYYACEGHARYTFDLTDSDGAGLTEESPQEWLSISIDNSEAILILQVGGIPYTTRVPCDAELAQAIGSFLSYN